jgi:hypothetical protein
MCNDFLTGDRADTEQWSDWSDTRGIYVKGKKSRVGRGIPCMFSADAATSWGATLRSKTLAPVAR